MAKRLALPWSDRQDAIEHLIAIREARTIAVAALAGSMARHISKLRAELEMEEMSEGW